MSGAEASVGRWCFLPGACLTAQLATSLTTFWVFGATCLSPPHGSEDRELAPSSHAVRGRREKPSKQGSSRRKKFPPPSLPPPPLFLPKILSPSFPRSYLLLSFPLRFLDCLRGARAAMMKKGKVVLAQPAALAPRMLSPRPPLSRAPAPVRGAGEEAAYRAGLRYRGLLQDYQELVRETEAKKRRLHMIKLMKRRLSAEVKFLRKRYRSMSENPSQTIVCRVRDPLRPPPTSRTTAWEAQSVPAVGSSSKSLPVQRRQLGPPRASPVIDLNEACEPSHGEVEMGDYHGCWEPLGINNTKRYLLEGDVAAGRSGVRMPVFWDIRNPAVRAGKRKISYRDQLVLGI